MRFEPQRVGIALVVAGLLVCSTVACSNPPTLKAIVPSTGYPRQLLAVDGDTALTSIVWDAGGAEIVMQTGVLGTRYFQVPENAPAGPHTVALRRNGSTSMTTTVTVLPAAPVTFPRPRIEDVGIFGMSGNGPVDVLLTIAAANLDVDATATVQERVGARDDDRPVAERYFWGGLPVDYQQAHLPETFEYPVYHYGQLIVAVPNVSLGATIHITVTNSDGQTGSFDYEMPGTTADLDSDGDGLLNSWEEDGYNASSGAKISLSNFGTNVWRKDILVEVDNTTDVPIKPTLWEKLEKAFRDAPVLNPDGSAGITLLVDYGQGGAFTNGGQVLPAHDCLTLENPAPAPPAGSGCSSVTSLFDYKGTYFDNDRLRLFHYVVWGNRHIDPQTGDAELWGNDFIVTLTGYASGVFTQLGTFMHELGHNLSLTHGNLYGDLENYTWKPNLPSVMTYRYQGAGVDDNCDVLTNFVFTFSQGMLKPLDETNVDESLGVCDKKPVNMDMVLGTTTLGRANLNWMSNEEGADMDTDDVWHDFDQWGNVHLNFTHRDSMWDND